MPMNDLLAQHQLAQLKARTATSDVERDRYVDLEALYATKIDAWRDAIGLSTKGWPQGAEPAD